MTYFPRILLRMVEYPNKSAFEDTAKITCNHRTPPLLLSFSKISLAITRQSGYTLRTPDATSECPPIEGLQSSNQPKRVTIIKPICDELQYTSTKIYHSNTVPSISLRVQVASLNSPQTLARYPPHQLTLPQSLPRSSCRSHPY